MIPDAHRRVIQFQRHGGDNEVDFSGSGSQVGGVQAAPSRTDPPPSRGHDRFQPGRKKALDGPADSRRYHRSSSRNRWSMAPKSFSPTVDRRLCLQIAQSAVLYRTCPAMQQQGNSGCRYRPGHGGLLASQRGVLIRYRTDGSWHHLRGCRRGTHGWSNGRHPHGDGVRRA